MYIGDSPPRSSASWEGPGSWGLPPGRRAGTSPWAAPWQSRRTCASSAWPAARRAMSRYWPRHHTRASRASCCAWCHARWGRGSPCVCLVPAGSVTTRPAGAKAVASAMAVLSTCLLGSAGSVLFLFWRPLLFVMITVYVTTALHDTDIEDASTTYRDVVDEALIDDGAVAQVEQPGRCLLSQHIDEMECMTLP